MKSILVTGGAGYIGSHTVIQLLQAGHKVVMLDNLCNSSQGVIARIEELAGKPVQFVRGDIRDREVLSSIFANNPCDAVIHFAGLKAVGQSQEEPLRYYDNNVSGSIVLFEEMLKAGVNLLIFSSSATVYGDPGYVCYTEKRP